MQSQPSAFARFLGHPPRTLDWVLVSSLASVLVLICACCSCVFLPGLARLGGGTTIYQVSNPPTATAAPTDTAAPPEKPAIGAPDSAFASAFSTRLDGQNWQVVVAGQTLDLHVIERAGNDGQQRIILAALDPLPAGFGTVTFPQATAVAYIKQFLPADAHETGTETEKDGTVTSPPTEAGSFSRSNLTP